MSKTANELAAAALGAAAPTSLAAPPSDTTTSRGAGLALQALGPALPAARYKHR